MYKCTKFYTGALFKPETFQGSPPKLPIDSSSAITYTTLKAFQETLFCLSMALVCPKPKHRANPAPESLKPKPQTLPARGVWFLGLWSATFERHVDCFLRAGGESGRARCSSGLWGSKTGFPKGPFPCLKASDTKTIKDKVLGDFEPLG